MGVEYGNGDVQMQVPQGAAHGASNSVEFIFRAVRLSKADNFVQTGRCLIKDNQYPLRCVFIHRATACV